MKKITLYSFGALAMAFAALWTLSLIVDARRVVPEPPETVSWLPGERFEYGTFHGTQTRYLVSGTGPDLILLHTFGTEIGQFRKVWAPLAETHRVWALDLPGFGYSHMPDEPLNAAFYANYVAAFMGDLGITNAVIAGESIGAGIPLTLAAQNNPSISAVVAINPVGFAPKPLRRAGRVGRVFETAIRIPLIKDMFVRFRTSRTTRAVLGSAVVTPGAIPEDYFADLFKIQQRPEFPQAQLSYMANSHSWIDIMDTYGNINVPVHFIWGESDWSLPEERDRIAARVTGATRQTVVESGHFMTMDQPMAIVQAISRVTHGR